VNLPQSKAQSVLDNPFFHRGPIRDRHYFFGRTGEIRQALQMLCNGQCVSIVGPRRIGKTSLLFHLCDSEVWRAHGLGEECMFVHIDCQGLGDLDKPQFYHWLWQETRRALAERGKDVGTESVSDFNGFRDAMMMIQREGYKPAFLLDEFETTARNPNLDKDLFSDLRSLVPAVVYATASCDSLYDLTYVGTSVLSSPFFNIFSEIPLGFLESKEAKRMISALLQMAGQRNFFTKKDLAFAFEIGGCYPFFLQLACYRLFEHKVTSRKLADHESVQRQYTTDAEPHFRYMWGHLDADERAVVWLVCKGEVSQVSDEQRRQLERKCIIRDDAIFSPAFAEFAQRQMTESRAEKTHGSVEVVDVASEKKVDVSIHQSDVYSDYEAGLHHLLNRLGRNHSHYSEALVYQQRLIENIAQSRQYGDTSTRKAERTEIIHQLNEFLLSILGVSFAELCGLGMPAERSRSDEARGRVKHLEHQDRIHESTDTGGQLHTDIPGTAQVFLSYAREDKAAVGSLYRRLSDAGFKPWMDGKDILPGEQWEFSIQQAIRRSDFFMVCLSANSVNKRGFLQKEIKHALSIRQEMLDSDIYLIPVRLEDCEVPESLHDCQWVDLFEKDGWTQLVKAIQVGIERRVRRT